MPSISSSILWFYHEFGLSSVITTGLDAWLLIFARSARMFAYGANSLIIALFFSALQFTDFQIGLFFSLTLLGDVLLSAFLTLVADKLGRRRVLLLGAALMVLSGAVFAIFENFWILLFAAVVGVISATGGDFGPFRAIEESTLSHLTTPKTRADVLSWYVTTASLGSAIGTLLSGQAVHYLQEKGGWSLLASYHAVFGVYVVMGSLNFLSTLMLSNNVEAEKTPEKSEASEGLLNQADNDENDEANEEANSRQHPSATQPPLHTKKTSFLTNNLSQISRETLLVMSKLWILLIIDSLADGMVSYSLTTYYIDTKFQPTKSTLGNIISASYLLSSISTVFAGPLARHLGLINTMVFTHLPSSLAVLFFPLPNNIVLMIILFFIRTGLNNMDQAPRSAFIAAVVKPDERTAVMGITSMLRTLAATCGPTVTGVLAGNDRFWIAFVAAGACRIVYDLGLYAMFVNMKLYSHEEKGAGEHDGRDEEELRELPATDSERRKDVDGESEEHEL